MPGVVVPEVAFRSFRWSFPDNTAAELTEGLVLKAEIVLRVEELREFTNGVRWVASVLEVGRVIE